MRAFSEPLMEVITFGRSDVIVTSCVACDECTTCEEGKNDCTCYEAQMHGQTYECRFLNP